MLTINQRLRRRLSRWYIVFLCAIPVVSIVMFVKYSKMDIGDGATIFSIWVAIYFGLRQLNDWKERQHTKSWRSDIISAAENSRIFGVDNGFYVGKSSDKLYNIAIAWRTVYKVPSHLDFWSVKHTNDYIFCVFFRVFPVSEDYEQTLSPFIEQAEFSLSPWWDYYTQISHMDGEYVGGISGNYNPKRKTACGLNEMNDTDFIYARQIVAKIHALDYSKMMSCKKDAEKYKIKYLLGNSIDESITVQHID